MEGPKPPTPKVEKQTEFLGAPKEETGRREEAWQVAWQEEFANIQRSIAEEEKDLLNANDDERVLLLREKLQQARTEYDNRPLSLRDENDHVTYGGNSPSREFVKLRLFEDAYKKTLESASDEVLDKEFQEVAERFIKEELAAGATWEDIEFRHFGSRSFTKDSEAHKNLKTLRSVYMQRDPKQFEREGKLFEDVLAKFPKTPVVATEQVASEITPETTRESTLEKTPEISRAQLIVENFAYQDVDIPNEIKQATLDWAKNSESAQKYADSLAQLLERMNKEEIDQLAAEIKEVMDREAKRLGIPVSPYGKSKTWAIWDIAKQNHFFTHPEENNPDYGIGDPLTSEAKREEIINRHLGWEAYSTFRGNTAPEWKQKIMSDGKFAKALEFFNKQSKENSTLSSKDLAELGRVLREIR